MRWCVFTFFAVLLFGPVFSVVAQTVGPLPCGNIIAPTGWDTYFIPNKPIITVPVTSCSNPFGRTQTTASPYTLTINGVVVTDGATIPVPSGRTNQYVVDDQNRNMYSVLFLHDANDYRYIDTELTEPVESDYRASAATFFPSGTDIEPYIAAINSVDPYNYFIAGDPEADLFSDFLDYFDSNFVPVRPTLSSGTYTLFQKEVTVIYSRASWWKRFAQTIIPTAYAQVGSVDQSYTITFTLTNEILPPTGASSILFLPGIQASRLYTTDTNGNENRIWEPNVNADVTKLIMTDAGTSVNQVYTRDVLDEIYGINNVYLGVLDMFEKLKDDAVIENYLAFAYDWRFSVTDIIQNGIQYQQGIKDLVAEVEILAEDSFTDKITVIGHSNGGLLAKALLTELERRGKAYLVDKVIFVGTPQLGAVKAIGSMLHGLDQQAGAGFIVDDVTARDVIRNMPGAYQLLPSQKYFDVSGDSVITADNSTNTASIRSYGDINSLTQLTNFVLDASNVRNDIVSINEPSTLNAQLMHTMLTRSAGFDAWQAPTSTEVYEIVGTGVPTIKSFEYRSFPCTAPVAVVCAFGQYMKVYPQFTDKGDETVATLSAAGYTGTKVSAEIDLVGEGAQLTVFEKEHSNLTESPTIQDYLDSIIRFPYLNNTIIVPPDFITTARTYTMIGSHSPVTLSVTDSSGSVAGIVNGVPHEDIPGSQYLELGGSAYIIIPATTNYTAQVKGTATGVYSLTIDSLTGDITTPKYVYIGASTTLQMSATFSASSSGFSTIVTDLNGDGITDTEQTLDGKLVVVVSNYTYADLAIKVKALGLPKLQLNLLLVQIQLAQQLSLNRPLRPAHRQLELTVLRSLEDTLKLYERKKIITATQLSQTLEIINYLKK